MNTRCTTCRALAAGVFLAAGSSTVAHAGVTTYSTFEEWAAAAGETMTMDFTDTGLPSGTFLTDQLVDSGITFREDDWVQIANADVSGIEDEWFIQNFNFDLTMWIDFTQPITAVAIDAGAQPTHSYQLWMDDVLVDEFNQNIFTFNGFVSTVPFNSIRIRQEGGGNKINVDDLHYSVIPGPPVAALLAAAALAGRGRRRR